MGNNLARVVFQPPQASCLGRRKLLSGGGIHQLRMAVRASAVRACLATCAELCGPVDCESSRSHPDIEGGRVAGMAKIQTSFG